VDWEKIFREMTSLSDEEFQEKVVKVAREKLYRREGQLLFTRLEELRRKLQGFFMCGA